MNDLIDNKLPKFLVSDPTEQMHALTISDPDSPLQPVTLPLVLRGVTLLLNVRPVTINLLSNQISHYKYFNNSG